MWNAIAEVARTIRVVSRSSDRTVRAVVLVAVVTTTATLLITLAVVAASSLSAL